MMLMSTPGQSFSRVREPFQNNSSRLIAQRARRNKEHDSTSGREQARAAPGTAKTQRREDAKKTQCEWNVFASSRLCVVAVKKSRVTLLNSSSIIAPANLS